MKKDITHLFYFVATFVENYHSERKKHALISDKKRRKPTRVPGLSEDEVATIILMFQESPSKNFKYFYKSYLQLYRQEFPDLPSYERFVVLMPRVFPILLVLLHSILTPNKNIGYVDATSLAVCHPKRISSHKVFSGFAEIGKTTKGWFMGMKLHLIVSDKGELINVAITAGNNDDRTPVPTLTKKFVGLLCGDKGYISKSLFSKLYTRGVKLVTGIKSNMKNCLMDLHGKWYCAKGL